MNKDKIGWIVVGVLVLAVVTGGTWYFKTKKAAAATSNYITGEVRIGSVSKRINATGTIQVPSLYNLSFSSKNKVTKVNVAVGDTVKAGQVLAETDNSSADQQLKQAKLNLAQAQLKLDQTKAGPTAVDLASMKSALARAESSVYNAQANLDNLKRNPGATDVQIQQARNALDSAQADYSIAKAQYDNKTATVTNSDIALASDNLDYWQQKLNNTSTSDTLQYMQVQASYQLALQKINDLVKQQAVNKYNDANNTVNTDLLSAESSLARAAASLYNAQTTLNNLENNPNATATAIQQAENNLKSVQADYELAKAQQDAKLAGPTDVELQTAMLQVEQSQANVAAAQVVQDETKIVAPVDGVITAVNGKVGELPGTTAFMVLMGTSNDMQIVVPADESDVGGVKVNQTVEVTLPAYPDKKFTGKVTQVAPTGKTQNNVTTFDVTVTTANTDNLMKPGMSANVSIIIAEKNNVLTVPSEAVRGSGQQKTVQLAPATPAEQPQSRNVVIGLDDGTNAEVIRGLQDGDEVVTGTKTQKTTTTQNANPFGGGGGRAIMGR